MRGMGMGGLVGFDDCDYNLHLSNSSYAKVSRFVPSEAGSGSKYEWFCRIWTQRV